MARDTWFETVAIAQQRAKKRLPRSAYSSLISASEKGISVSDNVEAFSELGFAPHVIGATEKREMATTVMGQDISMPVVISPTGVQAVDPDGEVAVARAAGAHHVVDYRTEDVVACLDAGADDYVTRPARLAEVCARVRALGRRDHAPRAPVLEAGDVRCDLATGEVTRDGRPVDLSTQQQAVLVELLRRPGHVLTRTELLESAWDPAADPGSNVVDQAVAALRRRIDAPFGREDIETVRGRGYRWKVG
mgnify:CR=1 FL=1